MANRWSRRASNRASCWGGALAAVFLWVSRSGNGPRDLSARDAPAASRRRRSPTRLRQRQRERPVRRICVEGQLIAADTERPE